VAGVDYPVGIPNGTPLTPIALLNNPQVSFTPGSNLVRCTTPGSSVVLDAVDFGNATLYDTTGCTWTVTSSHFGCPTNFTNVDVDTVSISHSEFNQAGCSSGPSSFISAGPVTAQYDWFRNGWQHVIETGTGSGTDMRFNLIDTMVPGGVSTGSHENFLQLTGTSTSNGITVQYNTAYQPSGGNGEGWQFYCNSGPCAMNNPNFSNNTMVSLPGANVSYFIHGNDVAVANGVDSDNYFDLRGAFGAYYPGKMNSWVNSGNLDLNTGLTITPG